MNESIKKLYRSRVNRVIAGVSGGIGEYFNIDPVIVRIVFVLLVFGHGVGLLIYLVLAIVLPNNPDQPEIKTNAEEKAKEFAQDLGEKTQNLANEIKKHQVHRHPDGRHWNIMGFILVIFGLVALINSFFPLDWLRWQRFWPIILIIIGFFFIFRSPGGKNA